MKLPHVVLLPAAALITCSVAALYFLRGDAAPEASDATSRSPSLSVEGGSGALFPQGPDGHSSSQLRQGRSIPTIPVSEIDPLESPPAEGKTENSSAMPSREELAERVRVIQRTSDARLARLTRDLNLSEGQQHKVFAILARSSPAFHPSLQIGVPLGEDERAASGKLRVLEPEPAGEKRGAEDQIFEVLDADQADLLAEQILDRDRWWEDIIGELEKDIDRTLLDADAVAVPPGVAPEVPSAASPSPASGPSPSNGNSGTTVPPTHGGGNLFDQIGK